MQSSMNYTQSSRPSINTESYGQGSPYRQNQYPSNSQLYTQTPPPSTDNLGYNQTAMNSLAQAFGAASLTSGVPVAGKQHNNSFGAHAANANMLTMQPNGQVYYHQLPDGTFVVSGMNNYSNNYQQYAGAYNLGASYGSYLPQPAYNGYAAPMAQGFANPSRSAAWGVSHNVPVEVPDLAAPRRNSSSSEENSPGPHTPFNFGMFPTGTYAYPATDNSLSPWTEPSPIQLAQNFPFEHYWRNRDGSYELVDYYTITRVKPAIPVAVPAKLTKDSGRGTFDKILDNEHGTTNVYIRGLHPDTTDEKLHGYGCRFGDILRCKAIIDLNTGGCKGFGFVEYHNYTDAENCIRCFYYLGYEAKFAKLSHNERLKNCADPENNNLYVSNLPKAMTETELKALFTGVFPSYKVTSTKVLKDEQGISRGVGFVRFEAHDICEKVIEHFINHPMCVGDDNAMLQLRYADSPAQKKLKEESAAHRGFKANEYNMEAFGPASPFYRSPMTPMYPSPLPSMGARASGPWRRQTSVSPGTSVAFQGGLGAGPTMPVAAAKSMFQHVLQGLPNPSSSINAESPCATATIKRTRNETSSIGGNTLVGSHVTDFSYQDTNSKPEDGSDSDPDAKVPVKVDSSSEDQDVNGADKVGLSPSKVNKAKL